MGDSIETLVAMQKWEQERERLRSREELYRSVNWLHDFNHNCRCELCGMSQRDFARSNPERSYPLQAGLCPVGYEIAVRHRLDPRKPFWYRDELDKIKSERDRKHAEFLELQEWMP